MEHQGRIFWVITKQVSPDAGFVSAMMALTGTTDIKRLVAYEVVDGKMEMVIDDPEVKNALASRMGLHQPDFGDQTDKRNRANIGTVVATAAAGVLAEIPPPLHRFTDAINGPSLGMEVQPENNKFGVNISTNAGLGHYLPEELGQIIDEFGGEAFSRLTYTPDTGISPNGTRLWIVKDIPHGPAFLTQFLERLKAVPPRYRDTLDAFNGTGTKWAAGEGGAGGSRIQRQSSEAKRLQVNALLKMLKEADPETPAAIRCYTNHDFSGVSRFPESREWETNVGLQFAMQGLDEEGLTPGLKKEKPDFDDGIDGRSLEA